MKNYDETELGKETTYIENYDPNLLCPISRKKARENAIPSEIQFYGIDRWTAYELSWLSLSGLPRVAIGTFNFPCDSTNVVESKSFKLYLNSFIQTKFASKHDVLNTIVKDLTDICGATVSVDIYNLDEYQEKIKISEPRAICIDESNKVFTQYQPDHSLLKIEEDKEISELLYSNLLKTNCPVTNQPDWASVYVDYTGPKIDRESLLEYIVSYRLHQDFHEICVEKIFCDLYKLSQPKHLSVCAKYMRRGGLDINPYRSTSKKNDFRKARHVRQ